MFKHFYIIVRDAAIACAACAVIGLTVNAARPDGLPLIADKPYEIFVPCPETLGAVETIQATDLRMLDPGSYIVDARSETEFDEYHLDGATRITYDYLDPISDAELENISLNIVGSGKARLIVYGDGDGKQGSTGYELGRELAGHGLKHVLIVEGGVDAIRAIYPGEHRGERLNGENFPKRDRD